MKINIVAAEIDSDQILARLAKTLVDGFGWTWSVGPDNKADINIYFPYLLCDGHANTKTVGWFTHHDVNRPIKVGAWEQAAHDVDLRLTSARGYVAQLSEFGNTRLVTPPLDRQKFSLATKAMSSKPIIGTSGMVYPSGRKGEMLFNCLADEMRQTATFVAAGDGWSVHTTRYSWRDLHTFYRGLDLYVCTSLIEGVGYGPLEALACGVPVVIPFHVGVFDDIPDAAGIYRYVAGDYGDLKRATRQALAELATVDREALRATTEQFSLDRWLGDWWAAMLELMEDKPMEQLPEWKGRAGVFYVAYGKPARDCATKSIKSFKANMPGVPVALVSDAAGCGEDIFIQNADEDIGGRSVKTKIYDLAPQDWQYVLYLDADTEVTADIGFLFDLLADGWEVVACYNPAQYVTGDTMERPDNHDECELTYKEIGTRMFLQYNGGVFAFRRCDRTASLFGEWHKEWQRFSKRDQAALHRVLYRQPVRIYTLGNEWNTILQPDGRQKYGIRADESAGILHYPLKARRWGGLINGPLNGSEAWAAVYPDSK